MNNTREISELEHRMIQEAEANGGSVMLDLSNDLHYEFLLEQNGGRDHMKRFAPNYLQLVERQRAAGEIDLVELTQNKLGLMDSEYIERTSVLKLESTREQSCALWEITATSIASYAVPKCTVKIETKLIDTTLNRKIAFDKNDFYKPDQDASYVFSIKTSFPVSSPSDTHEYRAFTTFTTTGMSNNGSSVTFVRYSVSPIFQLRQTDDVESIKVHAPVVQPITEERPKRKEPEDKIVYIAYNRAGIMESYDYKYDVTLTGGLKEMPVRLPLQVEIKLWKGAYFSASGEKGYLSDKIDPMIKLSRFVKGQVVVGGEAPLITDWADFARGKGNIEVSRSENGKTTGLKLTFPEDWKSYLSFDAMVNAATYSDLYVMIVFNTVQKNNEGIYENMTLPIMIYYHTTPPKQSETNVAHVARLLYQWGCFDKNTPVLTPSGYKRACALAIGDKVLTRHGKEIVIQNIITGSQENMSRITTENGSVFVTPGHTICTEKGHRPASQIVTGESVLAWDAEKQTEYLTRVVRVEENLYYGDVCYNLEFENPSEMIADGIFIGDNALQQTVQPSWEEVDVKFPEELWVIDREIRQLQGGIAAPAFVGADHPECLPLHYFAVKSLAICSGFPEEEAQRIAEFSQFIGDNATCGGLFVRTIPDKLNTAGLFCRTDGGFLVPIIPTAMNKWYDDAEVKTNDKSWFPPESGDTRRYDVIDDILSPFHYYSDSKNSAVQFNPQSLREVLSKISSEVQKSRTNGTWPDQGLLMKMGVYIHLLADTMLHEHFYAGRNLENLGRLQAVLDCDGKAITTYKPYKDYPYGKLEEYPLGIQQIGSVVHDCHARFAYAYPFSDGELVISALYSGYLTPDNSHRYARACREILGFLCNCRVKPSFDELTWENITKPLLIKTFERCFGAFGDIKTQWEREWTWGKDILYNYRYDAAAVYSRLVTGNTEKTSQDPNSDLEKFDEFFQFTDLLYTIKTKGQ